MMNGFGSSVRLLIVDDEAMIADTLAAILRRAGYETYTAYNGRQGLEAARTLAPQLVLSDVAMPEMDGITMAMEICRIAPEVKILLFSGQAATSNLLHSAEEKGFHFELLEKPIHPEEIQRRVEQALSEGVSQCGKSVA